MICTYIIYLSILFYSIILFYFLIHLIHLIDLIDLIHLIYLIYLIYLSIYLSIHPSIHPSIYLSYLILSISLSLYIYVSPCFLRDLPFIHHIPCGQMAPWPWAAALVEGHSIGNGQRIQGAAALQEHLWISGPQGARAVEALPPMGYGPYGDG